MPLNASGTLSLAGTVTGQSIALELSRSATGTISLNDTDVRSLGGVTTPSSTISVSSFYGKSVGVNPGGGVDPALIPNAAGLFIYARTGYHNENVNYLPTGATFTGGNYNSINFTVATQAVSYLWVGYFLAPSDGAYRFQTISDDGAYLWIGSLASAGFSTGNAAVNNGGLHGAQTRTSVAYSLTGGLFYPIRLLYGNSLGTGSIQALFNVNGGAFTNNGTGYYFYNTLTNGI
jgi:hypothetical protein